jgi:hypothetical protein
VDTAEVANGGKRNRDQTIKELPHGVATERDVGADNLALPQFKIRDGLLRLGQNGLLTSNRREIALDVGDLVFVRLGIDADVERNLGELRNLMTAGTICSK